MGFVSNDDFGVACLLRGITRAYFQTVTIEALNDCLRIGAITIEDSACV